MRFKTVITLILLSINLYVAQASVSVSTFMKEAAEKITSSRSLTSSFKIESQTQNPLSGKIAIKGNKFALTTAVSSTVYDGKTQWTISTTDKEISVFEPTDEEIAQVNPFAIIRNYNKDYSVKLISSDKNIVKIQLIPKQTQTSIKNVVITFAAATKQPQKMSITLEDGTVMQITISEIKTNVDIPASRFVVQTKDYPGYEIIDLR